MLRGIGIGAVLATAVMYLLYGNSGKALSDEEIRDKARELGMMTVSEFQDKELNSLKDKIPEMSEIQVEGDKTEDNDKSSSSTSDNKSTPSKKGGETGKSDDKADKTGESTDKTGNSTGTSESEKTEAKPAGTGNATTGTSEADKTKAGSTGNDNTKSKNTETGNGDTGKTEISNKDKKNDTVKPKTVDNSKKAAAAAGGKVNFSITAGMSSENVAASLKSLGIIDNSSEFNKYLVNNGYASKIKVGTFELQKGQSYAEIAATLIGR